MPKLIKTWKELYGMESENYVLDVNVEMGWGWVRDKKTRDTVAYLTTHTFYGSRHKYYTELLRKFGFDVELVSWDTLR